MTVAANEAKQVLRRNRRHVAQRLALAGDLSATSGPDVDHDLRDALRSLQPAERELLAHRYLVGLTSDEIGHMLGLSGEGVRSRLKRIRDRLQKELETDA